MDSHDGSPGDPAFHVEQRGIDFVPESERWATPRNIGALWAGSAINVEYFIYGALLMGFGFSFYTALSIIIIGNLSFFLLGLASLQGPETGTTAFAISRAPFGTQGSRLVSFFNWITQLGFETEGLILIVGAAIVLSQMAGVHVSSPLKVIFIILAAAIQAVMPYFGHATMVKVLRALIIPFGAIFVLFAIYDFKHGSASFKGFGGGWELYTAGIAFIIALSGLGWTECGNDYTRYLPRNASKGSIVGWIFVGTAIPEIFMMVLGAATFTFLSDKASRPPGTAPIPSRLFTDRASSRVGSSSSSCCSPSSSSLASTPSTSTPRASRSKPWGCASSATRPSSWTRCSPVGSPSRRSFSRPSRST